MLVLSRRIGESIVINDNVRVTVLSVSASGVRLGIEAPSEVTVDRSEVSARKEAFKDSPAYAALGAVVDPDDYLADAELAW